MACCYRFKLYDWEEERGCQFASETDFVTLGDGTTWCRFHLPMRDAAGNDSPKASWNDNEINKFNQAVILIIDTAIDAEHDENRMADLSGVVFPGDIGFSRFDDKRPFPRISLRHAAFRGDANFREATFSEDVDFKEAVFSESANFEKVAFSEGTDFKEVSFEGYVDFREATFSGDAGFKETAFSGDADFRKAVFSESYFKEAVFSGAANFAWADFSGHANFRETAFSGNAYFKEAAFSGNAYFGEAAFSGYADFKEAAFSGSASFRDVTFKKNASFNRAKFLKFANFSEATFQDDAAFGEVKFSATADFDKATFSVYADFEKASFSGNAHFNRATFLEYAFFSEAAFTRDANYSEASFKTADFREVAFTGDANYSEATFSGDVDFSGAVETLSGDRRRYTMRLKSAPGEDAVWTTKGKVVLPATPSRSNFQKSDFSGAIFGEAINFNNRRFTDTTRFRGTIFERAPKFHNAVLHQDTDFEGAEFRDVRSENAERNYRTLKLAMEKVRSRREEAMFFALEQRSLRHQPATPWMSKFVSGLYDWAAEYGLSFARPLWRMVQMFAWFWLSYWVLFGYFSKPQGPPLRRGVDILRFALEQVFRPFEVWSWRYQIAEPFKTLGIDELPLLIKAAATVETLFVFALLTLFLLALRKRFRML